MGSFPDWKDPLEGAWQPISVFLPGEFHGQKSLVGYSPWGCKELDMTKWLTNTHLLVYLFFVMSVLYINTVRGTYLTMCLGHSRFLISHLSNEWINAKIISKLHHGLSTIDGLKDLRPNCTKMTILYNLYKQILSFRGKKISLLIVLNLILKFFSKSFHWLFILLVAYAFSMHNVSWISMLTERVLNNVK